MDVRGEDLPRIFVFKFDEAAPTAAVAERFPLLGRHVAQRFLVPKTHQLLSPMLRRTCRQPRGIILVLNVAGVRPTWSQTPSITKRSARSRAVCSRPML